MFCQKCGISNTDSSKFCSNCGTALSSASEGKGLQQPDASTNISVKEQYEAFLGPNNQPYYLNYFLRFDDLGKSEATWHWPAFFLTFYWMLYRKMWLNAVIYFLLPYILLIPVGIISAMFGEGGGVLVGILYVLFCVAVFIFPPMYANALYYKHAKKKISKAISRQPDIQKQLRELSIEGGTSNVILILVGLMGFVAVVGILAAIAIPAYSDYTNRARTVQAVSIGKTATLAVSNYYYSHQQIPTDLTEAGFSIPADPNVSSISIDPSNGAITLTLANASLNGKSILFVPSLDSNKQIQWKCMSRDIEARQLPTECR